MKPSKILTFFVLYGLAFLASLATAIAPPGTYLASTIAYALGMAIGMMIPSFLFIVGTRNWTNRSWIAPALALLVWGGFAAYGASLD